MANNLVCWAENDGTQKWNMIKKKDLNGFLLELLESENVIDHTIFIVPTTMIDGLAIWLSHTTHKSKRVDFFHFFEDYGIPYVPPTLSESAEKLAKENKEKYGPETKYGFVSPDGRYFHCAYQGHGTLASNICFGLADTNSPELYLQKHGWCKIFKPLGFQKYSVSVDPDHCLTAEQADTLIQMGLDAADGFSKMLVSENR